MNAATLHQAIRVVKPILDRSNRDILVESNGTFSLEATNGSSFISYQLPPIEGTEFERVVPGKMFEEMVKASGNEISFEPLEEKILVNDLPLPAYETNAWPRETWKGEDGGSFQVLAKDLLQSLSKVVQTCSTNDSRHGLNSVFADGEAGYLVGSDGHRIVTEPVDWISPKVKRCIHRVTVKALIQSLKAAKLKEISLRWHPGCIVIKDEESYRFVGKLEEGEYPNYKLFEKHVPQGTKINMDRDELLGALKKARIMTCPRHKGVKLQPTEYGIQVSAINPDLGTMRTWVDTDAAEVTENTVIINIDYLLTALRKEKKAIVTLTFPAEDGQGILVDNELVMPMIKDKHAEPMKIVRPTCAKRYEPPTEPKPKTAKKTSRRPATRRKSKAKKVVEPKEKSQETETHEGFKLVKIKGHWRTSKTGKKYWVNEHVRRIRTKQPLKKAA